MPHIYDTMVAPDLDMRFDVEDTPLRNATLQEVLMWVYDTHIRRAWKEKVAV